MGSKTARLSTPALWQLPPAGAADPEAAAAALSKRQVPDSAWQISALPVFLLQAWYWFSALPCVGRISLFEMLNRKERVTSNK